MKWFNRLKLKFIDVVSGMQITETLAMLRAEQYLPADKLNAIRQQRLERLFKIATTSTAYYAPFHSYKEIPYITRQEMKQRPDDFLSSAYKGKLFQKFTGGTTGSPFKYATSISSQSNLWAGLLLAWENTGYEFGDKVAFIGGSALVKVDGKHKIFYNLLNIDRYPVSAMDDDIIAGHFATLRSRNTRLIYGYAMAINIIADYILQNNIAPLKGLKGIVCTSEVLTDKMRANIENAFKVKVYNQYGCNEAGISAFECSHGSMHLISSRCIYETNEEGILISTDLANDAYMFIKYDTNDIVEFGENKCGCGRSYPVISKIEGRGNELLVDKRNKKIHSTYFNFLFKNDKAVKQFQVAFDEHSFNINLLVDGNFTDTNKQYYLDIMKNNFLFDSYEMKINEKFLTGKNFKHTYIIDNRKKQETA